MKDYITGLVLLFIITLVIWFVQNHFLPNPFSVLEIWGLVTLFIMFRGLVDEQKTKNIEN